MSSRVVLWSITSALAGFLFGFDTVVISGAERTIQSLWNLSAGLHGVAVASALYGTVLGSLFGGWPTDRFGRRATLVLIGVLYLIGAIWSALAINIESFIAARSLGGLGIGISTVVAPLYISEISPPKHRGLLAGMFQFNIVFGILVAYLSNSLLAAAGPDAWRWMLGVAALPSLTFTLACFGLPESPRWLISRKQDAEGGLRVLRLIRPEASPQEIYNEAAAIRDASSDQGSAANFWNWKLRKPIALAVSIAFFNQLSGINAILYFAPRIFELTGLAAKAALLQSIGIGVTNLIFTCIGLWLIDRLGRRTLLYIGSCGYIASLGLVSWAFFSAHYSIVPSARHRSGRSHLGLHFRDFSQSPTRGRSGAGQLHSLDFCRAADFLFSQDGVRVCARLRIRVLCRDDGAAAGLGEDHGNRDQGGIARVHSGTPREELTSCCGRLAIQSPLSRAKRVGSRL